MTVQVFKMCRMPDGRGGEGLVVEACRRFNWKEVTGRYSGWHT